MAWTKETADELIKLRATGMAFSRIAETINRKFGTALSRNACIGLAARLALGKDVRQMPPVGPAAAQARRDRTTRLRREALGLAPIKRERRRFDVAPPKSVAIDRTPQSIRQIAQKPSPIVTLKGVPLAPDTRPMRCAEVEPRHLSLMELTPCSCRWPYGDRKITFCGHPRIEGSSYCDAHDALSTAPHERKFHRTLFGRAA